MHKELKAICASLAGVLALCVSPASGQTTSPPQGVSCLTEGVPNGAWVFAREWDDDAGPAPGDASPFKASGWDRVSKRLAEATQSVPAPALTRESLVMRVLGGPDKERYCAALKSIQERPGRQNIDVPLELLQVRDVVSALANELPAMADELRKSNKIDGQSARAIVLSHLKEHREKQRLGEQLRVLEAFVRAGNALPGDRPADWPAGEAWPPPATALAEWRAILEQWNATEVRICSEHSIKPAPVQSDQLRSLSGNAKLLSSAVTNWVASCLQQAGAATAPPPTPEGSPVVVAASLDVGRQDVERKATSDITVKRVELALNTVSPPSPAVELSIDLYSTVQGRDIREQLPLGIVVRRVTRWRSPDGKTERAIAENSQFVPGIDSVKIDQLQSSLRHLGLPPFAVLKRVEVADLKNDFSTLVLSGTVAVPALGLEPSFELAFQKDGKLADPFSLVHALARSMDIAVIERLKSIALEVDVQALGKVSVDNTRVVTAAGPSVKTLTATISVRLPAWLEAGSTVQADVAFEISLLGERSMPKLVNVKIQPAGTERLLATMSRGFQRALDALELGQSGCIQLQRLDLQVSPGGVVRLVGAVAFRGRHETTPVAIPLQASPGDFFQSLGGALGVDQADLARCVRDRLLERAGEAVGDWVDKLNNDTKIPLFGSTFMFEKAQWISAPDAGAKMRGWFQANLVAIDDPELRLERITLDGSWRPESGPPHLEQLTIQAASFPPAFAEHLLTKYAPQLAKFVSVRGIRYVAPNLASDVTLKLPAPVGELRLDNVQLTAGSIAESLRKAIEDRCFQEVGKLVNQLIGPLSQSMGSVEIRSPSLNTTESRIFATDGQFDPKLVFDLAVYEDNLGVALPFKVTLPGPEIHPAGNFKALVTAALMKVLNKITGPLGNLAAQAGVPIKNPQAIVDTSVPRYGVAFDLDVMIGGIVDFGAEGIVVDQHGLTLPPSFKIDVKHPIVLSAFQLAEVGGTLWRQPAGRFEVRTNITFTGDRDGIALMKVGLKGAGRAPVFHLDGELKVVGMSLLEVKGDADLERTRMNLDAKTLNPLARILAYNAKAEIDGQKISLQQNAGLALLGFKTTGRFDLDLPGREARLHGKAKWEWLGNAAAELDFVMKPDLRNARASGAVELPFRSITARVSLSAAKAEMGFEVFGIKVKIIAPSAMAIDEALLKRIIESLLDFKLSWDALRKMDVTINLLDSNGQPTSESAGGGDPLDSKASVPPQKGDEAPRVSPGVLPPDPPRPLRPETVHSSGAGGSWRLRHVVTDDCAYRETDYFKWESTKKFGREWYSVDGRTPSDILFESLSDEKYVYPALKDSNFGRIATKEVVEALGKGRIISCHEASQLPFSPYEVGNQTWASPKVAIIGSPRNEPPSIRLLTFRVNSKPVELVLPSDAANAVFGMPLQQAAQSDWTVDSEAGRRILHAFAEHALGSDSKIDRIYGVTSSDLIPEWRSNPKAKAYLTKETADGQNQFRLFRERDAPSINPSTPLSRALGAQPDGLLAELAAAAPVPDQNLLVDANPESTCLLAEAVVGSSSSGAYLVALNRASASALWLVESQIEFRQLAELLRRHCSALAKASDGGELAIHQDVANKTYVAAWRIREGATFNWYMSVLSPESKQVERVYCMTEASFNVALAGIHIRREALDWGADEARRRQMLNFLSQPKFNVFADFYADPRGVFMRNAKPAPSCQ